AAPTGRAAKRMMSATDFHAATIHATLGCIFEKGQFTFIHNEKNKLNADLIIIDEISMITTDLMARVLDAVNTSRTKLLLIGDAYQLPSVGAGAVLRDLLASKVIPHIELDIIHRNSGEIVSACHKIKEGTLYTPFRKLDLESTREGGPINLIHIECFTPEETLQGVKKLMCDVLPGKYKFDPVEDIQVISPVNSRGVLSCDSLNEVLRDELNPVKKLESLSGMVDGEDENNSYKFRRGDKVINIRNMKAETTDGDEVAIVNGDIGIVQSVGVKTITILFSDPDRKVVLLKSENSLLHAYTITAHKFQGSEAPVIIIPLSNQFSYFLNNAWIYTSISRAKVICITIGSFGVVEKAIRNRQPNIRVTRLKERLIDADRSLIEKEFSNI
nr:AAA family ATPase [Spirochaetales bacterium]